MKKAASYNSLTRLMAIRNPEGVLITSDRGKAGIQNENFSTIGETLAGELPIFNVDLTTYATSLTPTIMHIELTPGIIKKALLKPGKEMNQASYNKSTLYQSSLQQ